MARIVCQVLHRAGRISFLWSRGEDAFEPYHLLGREYDHFLTTAQEARSKLADAQAQDPVQAGAELSQLGVKLYQAIFRTAAADRGAAAEVQTWLSEQKPDPSRLTLEIVSDMPGQIPWNLVCESAQGASDFGPHGLGWEAFWGLRFNLAAGRRVNVLRQTPWIEAPTVLLVLDPDLAESFSSAEQELLQPWREKGELIESVDGLKTRLGSEAPDVMILVCRGEWRSLQLGSEHLSLDTLRAWIDEAPDGNPHPLLFWGMVHSPEIDLQDVFNDAVIALENALANFDGLIATEASVSTSKSLQVALLFVEQFLDQHRPLGASLQAIRESQPLTGLALTAFAPPNVRVYTDDASSDDDETTLFTLPETPYRPFAPYAYQDHALFSGRDKETEQVARLLDDTKIFGCSPGSPLVIVHGHSLVGKTSFLQAGLMPHLEFANLGYRILRDRSPQEEATEEFDYPVLLLRATNDLAGQFADAILAFASQPYEYKTPTGGKVHVDLPGILRKNLGQGNSESSSAIIAEPIPSLKEAPTDNDLATLWSALQADLGLLAHLLDDLTRQLPFELVIMIDRGEELLTEVTTTEDENRRRLALEMLALLTQSAARCKVLLGMRSDYVGRFVSVMLSASNLYFGWREFYMEPLDKGTVQEAIRLPISPVEIPGTDEIPYRKYDFTFESNLAKQIVDESFAEAASNRVSPLLYVQTACGLLYESRVQARKVKMLKSLDLKQLGGLSSAPQLYLDSRLRQLNLTPKVRTALEKLILALTTRNDEGNLTLARVTASSLKLRWSDPTPVEPIVNQAAQDANLFSIQKLSHEGKYKTYVSVADEGIAETLWLKQVERKVQAYGRSRIIDTLWIMIPLLFLAASASFALTRRYMTPSSNDEPDKQREVKELILTEKFYRTQMPLYRGQLVQAEQAIRAGNPLRARQLLQSMPARFTEIGNEIEDLRGFDWRYLWRQLNSEKYRLEGHAAPIQSVVVSPNGNLIASSSADGKIELWSLTKGERVASLIGSLGSVHALAFSPDNKTLASAGADKLVRLWDLEGVKDQYVILNKETKAITGHDDVVFTLAFGNDGQLASAGADQSVILWNLEEGKIKARLKDEAKGAIHTLAFSSDGKQLASAGKESVILLWDIAEGKKERAITTPFDRIASLAFEPKGSVLAAGGGLRSFGTDLGQIRFFDPTSGKETREPIQHSQEVFRIAYRADGKALASAGKDPIVRLWDTTSGQSLGQWTGHFGWVQGLVLTDQAVVTGSVDGVVRVFEANSFGGPQVLRPEQGWIQTLALGDNDKIFASGGRDGSVRLWDSATGRPVGKLPNHDGAITGLAFFSGNDKQTLLAVGTRSEKNEGEIKVWEIQAEKDEYQAKEFKSLKGHSKGITALIASGDRLLSGSADGTAILWDVKAGKEKTTFKEHQGEIRSVAFVEGSHVLTAGDDRKIRLWDVTTGQPVANMTKEMASGVEALAFLKINTGQKQIPCYFTADQDHALRLWLLQPGKGKIGEGQEENSLLLTYRVHSQSISSLIVRSGLIATGSWDHTIQLYDLERGERLALTGHTGTVQALAATADSSLLISGSQDGTIRLWRASKEMEAKPRKE